MIAFWSVIQEWFFAFYHGKVFFAIKIFLAIYSAVLIVDVILLVYLGDVRKQVRQMRKGTKAIKATKRAELREWNAIMNRLKTEDANQYKAAILEGDNLVFKSLDLQGYGGANFAERLAQIPTGSFQAIDAVRDVHALSNKIVHDDKAVVTREQAENALGVYEKFLKAIDVL